MALIKRDEAYHGTCARTESQGQIEIFHLNVATKKKKKKRGGKQRYKLSDVTNRNKRERREEGGGGEFISFHPGASLPTSK